MNEASDNKWSALRLASVAIARNDLALEQLLEKLTQEYTDSDIAGIWRRARIGLTEADICWLEDELHRILIQETQAIA